MKITYRKIWLLAAFILAATAGCKKFIQADMPIDKIPSDQVYGSLPTAISAVSGIYASMNSAAESIFIGISANSSLLADELGLRWEDPGLTLTYLNNLNGNNVSGIDGFNFWVPAYKLYIYRANAAIKGIAESAGISDAPKTVLTGELKFIRAWIYFLLVNYYGDVPLTTEPDFKTGQNIPRSDKQVVYEQIISDLQDAQASLTDHYLSTDLITPTPERVRPNKATATALLARVYLFTGQWQKAEEEANKVIAQTANYELLPLNDIFLKNSREAIWQMQPAFTNEGTNTFAGKFFLNMDNVPGNSVYATSQLLLDAFEPGDARRTNWFVTLGDYEMPYKYKIGGGDITQEQEEYTMVFRLSELYLIRAEARARLNRLTGPNSAAEDLNAIRRRAQLGACSASTQEQWIAAIIHERYVEMFTEWGDRWMTLKRTGTIDTRMAAVAVHKQSSWEPYKALLPIPYSEFNTNSSLRGHQNPGYFERP